MKNFKILVSVLVLASLTTVPVLIFAADEELESTSTDISLSSEDNIDEEAASRKINEIRESLNSSKSDLTRSIADTSLLEQRLGDVTDLIQTLSGQLSNIDEQLGKTEKRIILTTVNIERNEEQIEALMSEIALLVRQIENQKKNLKDLLLVIYFQSEQAGFFDESELQTIKLLLSNEQVSDMLERVDSLSTLEFSLGGLILDLDNNRSKLETDKQKVEETTEQLRILKDKLASDQVNLVLQKTAKENLLAITQGEEKLYTELLNRARQEQLSIRQDYIGLARIYRDYQGVLNKDGFAMDDFTTTGVLSWPTPPSLGISAYFRDPSYKAALGLEHYAIDIRVPQGTPIYAAADGIVLKSRGGTGNDYHYIVIGHNSEVLTLYGHMYDIFVQVGQSVNRGDLIGLSGGMPGTRGAGWLTTGPHLHFEVFENGKHVDPMKFLDVSVLPTRYQR